VLDTERLPVRLLRRRRLLRQSLHGTARGLQSGAIVGHVHVDGSRPANDAARSGAQLGSSHRPGRPWHLPPPRYAGQTPNLTKSREDGAVSNATEERLS
jgi:hypothetical protein